MGVIIGTQAECELVQKVVDVQCGYPRRENVKHSGGIHPEVPDVFESGAFGWTEHYAEVYPNEAGDQFMIDVGPFEFDDLKLTKLTGQERSDLAKLRARFNARTPRPAKWDGEAPPNKPGVPPPTAAAAKGG